MKVSRTGITQCSKLIKSLSGSGVSVTSRIGALSAWAAHVQPVADLFQIQDTRSTGQDKGKGA